MRNQNLILFFGVSCLLVFAGPVLASTTNGTIDATNKYAWSSTAGWINFGCTNCGVVITDSAVTGYIWSENYGWINLNPTQSGVTNDANGNLSGSAWGENVGWVDFSNVTIDASGSFKGTAAGDVVGTIAFENCGDSCGVATDWRPISQRAGPNISQFVKIPGPVAPAEGFSVVIKNGAEKTNNTSVMLGLRGGQDTVKVEISYNSDFIGSSIQAYEGIKAVNLPAGDGEKIIYVKFLNNAGGKSEVFFDKIILDTTPPKLNINKVKDEFEAKEEVVISGKTESGAELSFSFDQKGGSINAENNGNWRANLGILSPGTHTIIITAKDDVGNSTNLSINVKIKGEEIMQDNVNNQEGTKSPFALIPSTIKSITENLGDKIKSFVGQKTPSMLITVSKTAPASLTAKWNLLPVKAKSSGALEGKWDLLK